MSDTNFVNQVTVTDAAWFQDVNNMVYRVLGNGVTPLPATVAALLQTLGITAAAGSIPYSSALDTLGYLTLDTDGTLGANSDTHVPSQKAIVTRLATLSATIPIATQVPPGSDGNVLTASGGTWVSSPQTALPTGSLVITTGSVAPPGTIKANGALLSRTTYAILWAYAQASGNITASDGAWSVGTTPGKFSPGDGSTTFRIPDARGLFLRALDDSAGIDSGRTIGSYQADLLGSHVHNLEMYQATSSSSGCGAGPQASTNPSCGSAAGYVDATGGVETRPKNYALLVCIKY